MKTEYEYKVIIEFSTALIEIEINKSSKSGWELVNISISNAMGICYCAALKRIKIK